MEVKICNKCNESKTLDLFNIRKDSGKHRGECKACQALFHAKYRELNGDTLKTKFKEKYYLEQPERLLKAKEYYKQNSEHIKNVNNQYYKNNKEKIQPKRREYQQKRLKSDPVFRVTRNLRNRLWYALKHKMWKKGCSFAQYIGMDNFEDLQSFLQKNFTKEMTWDNYGTYWDIDHIIPLSSAKNEEDLYKLCHYTNLLPREQVENRILKRDGFNFNTELVVSLIDYNQGQDFVQKHHYLKNKFPAEYTFGMFLKNGTLVGVCTFHTPFSNGLKEMICGPEYKLEVIELNRLAVIDAMPKNSESWFVAQCLNSGEIQKHIVVSFADTDQNHNGTIYQALNFIYTGLTDKRKDFAVEGLGQHSTTVALKHTAEELKEIHGDKFAYKDRTQKHRYIKFIGNARIVKELNNNFKLEKKEYP